MNAPDLGWEDRKEQDAILPSPDWSERDWRLETQGLVTALFLCLSDGRPDQRLSSPAGLHNVGSCAAGTRIQGQWAALGNVARTTAAASAQLCWLDVGTLVGHCARWCAAVPAVLADSAFMLPCHSSGGS